jgi:glycosyltransferase involved in cell wall biosynthesis
MTSSINRCDVTKQGYAHIVEIELTKSIEGLQRQDVVDGMEAMHAWALVRLFGEPLGLDVIHIPPKGLSPETVEELVLARHMARLGQLIGIEEENPTLDTVQRAVHAIDSTSFSRAHADFVARAPRCSVVVCTRERPEHLRRCLHSLITQDHPNFAVWVIDNSPTSDDTRQIVNLFSNDLDIRYEVEPHTGLSRARNRGLRSGLEGDVVAWLDDDEIADPLWLSELARAFDGRAEMVAASGAVIPAELATQAQVWFEQFGGHSKGRGFMADEFSPHTWRKQHPLYPLPPFGVGANMAFRIDALSGLNGFDEALGAGTPAQAAEDTKVFSDLLRAGGTVAYTPSALTRHFHRRDLDALRRQMRGYGSGLSAFYTASVLGKPITIVDLIRLAPRAWHDFSSPDSLRVATLEEDFPRELLSVNRSGLIAGPFLYIHGRVRNWLARH